MNIPEEYLALVRRISDQIQLPVIKEILVAAEQEHGGKSSKFGALVLEDDTVGLTYVDLEQSRKPLLRALKAGKYVGQTPVAVAKLYAGDRGWQRSLGMAAINAISQYVLRDSIAPQVDSGKTLEMLVPHPSDHIGMVGYFPPLVDQIRQKNIALTVIELDQQWVQQDEGFLVTLDLSMLNRCNKVFCTGTVLINQSLDRVLAHTGGAEEIYIIGPTVGCLPDPLFNRGVTAVGGRQITNRGLFVEMWGRGQPWRSASKRYVIHSENYPGYKAALAELNSN